MKKGRVLKSGHCSRYVVLVSVPAQPDQQAMKEEFARLIVEGLRGVTGVCGKLKVTIGYDGKEKR